MKMGDFAACLCRVKIMSGMYVRLYNNNTNNFQVHTGGMVVEHW